MEFAKLKRSAYITLAGYVDRLSALIYFEPPFVYGMILATSAVMILLMKLNGWNYVLDPVLKQIHAYTLLWICVMFWFFYYRLSFPQNLYRFVISFLAFILVFYIHDSFWIIGTIKLGVRLEGTTVPATASFLIESLSRNASFIMVSAYFTRKYFDLELFGIMFLAELTYWIWNIFLQDIYLFPIYPIIDSLPCFAIAKTRKDET